MTAPRNARVFALFCGLLTSCGPPAIGPWQTRAPAGYAPADLSLRRCDPGQGCAFRLTSFAKQSWSFDPQDPKLPCSVWLDASGTWQSKSPSAPLLELWLGAIAQGPCPKLGDPRKAPRWMLLDQPVESAQTGGMGTRRPRFTLSRQVEAVKTALIQGHVDGVVALGQGSTELLQDLERATIRSARQWLDRRVFSLIFGKNPALGPAPRGLAARSHRPELWSDQQDLRVDFDGIAARNDKLSLKVHGRKKTASFTLPRLAPRHSPMRERAHVEPCLDCAPRRQDPRDGKH